MTQRRPGSRGPLPSLPDRTRWTIYLPGDLAREVDRIIGLSQRSAWVRELIERELHRMRHDRETVEIVEKLGGKP